jgi:hypothetical protein
VVFGAGFLTHLYFLTENVIYIRNTEKILNIYSGTNVRKRTEKEQIYEKLPQYQT